MTTEERNRINRNAEINGLVNGIARIHATTEDLYSELDVMYWIACKIAFDDTFDVATIRSLADEMHTFIDRDKNKLGRMRDELYKLKEGLKKVRYGYGNW